jgi:hypothetical protein
MSICGAAFFCWSFKTASTDICNALAGVAIDACVVYLPPWHHCHGIVLLGPVVQSRIIANRVLNLIHCFGLWTSVHLFISKIEKIKLLIIRTRFLKKYFQVYKQTAGQCWEVNLETKACNPLWRPAEALGNISEIRALIGCFSSANYYSNCESI